MSVWTTKALNRDRKYILLKHPLKGVNYTVQGIKFRAGYAVVEKDSKTYFLLKKMPILRNAEELPLSFLKKLPFVTRNVDVKIIYGQDVYRFFLQELEQVQSAEAVAAQEKQELEHAVNGGCLYRTRNQTLCEHQAIDNSPSQYCRRHLLEDTKLESLNIHVPRFIAKDEEEKLKLKVIKQLEKVKVNNGQNIGESKE